MSKKEGSSIMMDVICEDQRYKRVLKFSQQHIFLIDGCSQVDLKASLELNEALRYTLQDCSLFLIDGQSEISIGILNQKSLSCSTKSFIIDLPKEMIQAQTISISFLRINIKDEEMNFLKSPLSTTSNPSTYSVSDQQTRTCNTEVLIESPLPKLSLTNESSSPLKKRKRDEIPHYQFDGDKTFKRAKMSLSLEEQDDERSSESNNQEKKEKLNASKDSIKDDESKQKLKKSQERTVREALEIVIQWRERQDYYKKNNIGKDFQQVSEEIGVSKKTLDYYYLELRTAEFFKFDFDNNLRSKMGFLREFINQEKKKYQEIFQTEKIPRQSQLKYRIPSHLSGKGIEQKSEYFQRFEAQIENLNQFQQSNFPTYNSSRLDAMVSYLPQDESTTSILQSQSINNCSQQYQQQFNDPKENRNQLRPLHQFQEQQLLSSKYPQHVASHQQIQHPQHSFHHSQNYNSLEYGNANSSSNTHINNNSYFAEHQQSNYLQIKPQHPTGDLSFGGEFGYQKNLLEFVPQYNQSNYYQQGQQEQQISYI